MRKVMSCGLIMVIISSGAFWGCSDQKEPVSEKGVIQEMTEATANEAADRIRSTIDKARSAAKQQEESNRKTHEAAQPQ